MYKEISKLNNLISKAEEAIKQERHEDFVKLVDEILKYDPTNPKFLLSKAQALELIGELPKALDCYNKSLTFGPYDLEAQEGRDRLSALSKKQIEIQTWIKKGQRAHQRGKLKDALAFFEKVVTHDPQNSEAWDYRGIILYDLLKPDKAFESYEMAIKLNPNNPDAWMHEGVALGPSQESINRFNKALSINPNHINCLYNKGVRLRELGRFTEAIECLDKVLALDPEHVAAKFNKDLAQKGFIGTPSYGRSFYALRALVDQDNKKKHESTLNGSDYRSD